MLFTEKYRPKTVEECILPEKIKKVFLGYVEKGEIPHLILSGTPGIGKTTLARAVAEEIGASVLFLNSSDERGINVVRTKIKNFAGTVSLAKSKKIIILDEADNITPDAQDALRGIIEEFSSNCRFIFTCNHSSKIIDAIRASRCTNIDFSLRPEEKVQLAKEFFARCKEIFKKEGIAFDKGVVVKVIQDNFPDFRRTLNEFQKMSTNDNTINEDSLKSVSSVRDIEVLVNAIKEKDFMKVKKYVSENVDIAQTKIFEELYKRMGDMVRPEEFPIFILMVDKYITESHLAINPEIHVMAFICSIWVECDVKDA